MKKMRFLGFKIIIVERLFFSTSVLIRFGSRKPLMKSLFIMVTQISFKVTTIIFGHYALYLTLNQRFKTFST